MNGIISMGQYIMLHVMSHQHKQRDEKNEKKFSATILYFINFQVQLGLSSMALSKDLGLCVMS